ncbi:MAG TPA: hypothetical protein VFG32_10085 [Bacteroidota bacterium]|jgi:hypothetical protein|nr:hypothetical protein [Bacteroidota bacterium]
MKKLLAFVGLAASGVLIWFVFALWIGLYSFYSYPPSKEHPDGATLIVSRDEWEPRYNSPDYKPPEIDKDAKKGKGIGFGNPSRPRRPISIRTIVKLPYIEWLYEKSLQPQEP